jgi:3',5'-cyclic AMP phosphodiesterase CpdA
MIDPNLILREPSLGQPIMLANNMIGKDIIFSVNFGGKTENLDVKSILDGNLFLQFIGDTKEVLQKKCPNEYLLSWDNLFIRSIWSLESWPKAIKDRLIPLKILKIYNPQKSPWTWISPQLKKKFSFDYLYSVDICINSSNIKNLNHPQLFNFIHNIPADDMYNINFHSVYIHQNDWHKFKFIHASDSHIALRNDYIENVIKETTGVYPLNFINFNENFREFIRHANELHRAGELDFIILSGDIVDYIMIVRFQELERWEEYQDNFELFRDLITAWPSNEHSTLGEELEVPIFTILGNHDYRPGEYPLIAKFTLIVWDYQLSEYPNFGLSKEEAIKYQEGEAPLKSDGLPTYGPLSGIYFQSSLKSPSETYVSMINPDLDYVINLGDHKIICLDSGSDKGEFADVSDAINYAAGFGNSKSRWNFKHSAPDGEGFSQYQMNFLEENLKNAKGLAILCSHHPILNYYSNPPHHLFRETEHKEMNDDNRLEFHSYLSGQRQVDLYKYYSISKVEDISKGVFSLKNIVGEHINKVSKNNIEDYPSLSGKNVGELIGYDTEKKGFEKLKLDKYYLEWMQRDPFPFGWSFGKTPYFRKGPREYYIKPYLEPLTRLVHRLIGLGYGVPDSNFDLLLKIIFSDEYKNPELILAGHTHKCIEFRIKKFDNDYLYFHDYYSDNTLNGLSPGIAWNTQIPKYSDPLNRSNDPKNWWHNHKPLQVQAPSVGYPSGGIGHVGFLYIEVKNDLIKGITKKYFKARMLRSLKQAAEKADSSKFPISLRDLAQDVLFDHTISMKEFFDVQSLK